MFLRISRMLGARVGFVAANRGYTTVTNRNCPPGVVFTPPDNTPTTVHSDATGKMIDDLSASAPDGLPQGFAASRSQSLTANGFSFKPTQQQSYGQSLRQ